MVEANTSSLMLSVDTPWVDSNASGVSHSRATTVTLSLLSPALRKASSTSSGTACETGLRASCLAISSSLKGAPQAVRAQQQAVALLQVHGPGDVVDGLGGRAQAGKQHVAVHAVHARWGALRSSRYEWSRVRVSKSPSRTMYSRESPQWTHEAAPPCNTAATSVVRGVSIMPFLRRIAESGGGRRAVRREEFLHILDLGLGLALEQCRDGLQRDLRSHLALRVPAHAVGQHKEPRLAGVAVPHAVFVLFAAAAAADLETENFIVVHANRDAHRHRQWRPFAPQTRLAWIVFIGLGSDAGGFTHLLHVFLVSDTRVSSCRRIFSATESLV